MKKHIITFGALLSIGFVQAQVSVNNGVNTQAINNSNVILDASTAFSTEAGAPPNMGKGVVIPSVDLVNFEFDLTLADGSTFPTYFDGMIVYNKATGNTLTTGKRPTTSTAVTPGYYYFYNPNGAKNGNIKAGEWRPMNAGTNIYNSNGTVTDASRIVNTPGGVTFRGSNPGVGYVDIDRGINTGKLQLYSGSPSQSGHIGFFRGNGNNQPSRLGYIGYDNDNLTYWAEGNANNIMNSAIGANIFRGTELSAERSNVPQGRVQLVPGDTAHSGYIGFINSGGGRVGYIGYDNGNLNFQAEGGGYNIFNAGNGHVFNGTVVGNSPIIGNSEIYAGVNNWFRVRGSSGLYWENFGGGWYMADTTWLRAYNNKWIYTGGVGRFDTRVETSRLQGVSDMRLKKDIKKIENATEKLNKINGYTYTWRDKKDFPGQAVGEGKDIGVIAQEMEKVFPETVLTNEHGYKSVNYNALIPVLIEALKESNQKIADLENRLNAMQGTKPTAASTNGSGGKEIASTPAAAAAAPAMMNKVSPTPPEEKPKDYEITVIKDIQPAIKPETVKLKEIDLKQVSSSQPTLINTRADVKAAAPDVPRGK